MTVNPAWLPERLYGILGLLGEDYPDPAYDEP